MDAILERLGKNPKKIIFAISDAEYELINLRKQINDSLVSNSDKKLFELLDVYKEKTLKRKNRIDKFIITARRKKGKARKPA